MVEIGVDQAFDDDLIFGNVVSDVEQDDVFVTQRTDALSDAACATTGMTTSWPRATSWAAWTLSSRLKVISKVCPWSAQRFSRAAHPRP
jgi:hypothetical protein